MNIHDLSVPRLLYKGRDDQGELPRPFAATPMDQVLRTSQEADRLAREELERLEERTQTCRVETHEELADKLKEGWRLHRAVDKSEVKDAEAARKEAEDVQEEADASGVPVEAVAQARDAKKKK